MTPGYDAELRKEYRAFVKRKKDDKCSFEQFVAIGHSSGASAIYNEIKEGLFAGVGGADGRRFEPSFLGLIDMVLTEETVLGVGSSPSLAKSDLRERVFNVYQTELLSAFRGKPVSGVQNLRITKKKESKVGHYTMPELETVVQKMSWRASLWYHIDAYNEQHYVTRLPRWDTRIGDCKW